jgi:hypothetical protein
VPRSAAESLGLVVHRVVLLRTWALTLDPDLRQAIECELYGAPDPERAREEAERLTDLG